MTTPKWYIFSHNSSIKQYFDGLIIILAIYNGIYTPLSIAFPYVKHLPPENFFKRFDVFVEIAFYMDMIVAFLTSYIDQKTGDEVFSLRKIAMNYICEGDFMIDFLSTVDFIGMIANFRKGPISNGAGMIRDSLSMLKVFRIRKLLNVIREMNETT